MASISINNYTSRNAEALCVSIGPIDLYFSYKTVIAFRAPGFGSCVRENSWGPTTGRHIKETGFDPGISQRMNGAEFDALVEQIASSISVNAESIR